MKTACLLSPISLLKPLDERNTVLLRTSRLRLTSCADRFPAFRSFVWIFKMTFRYIHIMDVETDDMIRY